MCHKGIKKNNEVKIINEYYIFIEPKKKYIKTARKKKLNQCQTITNKSPI